MIIRSLDGKKTRRRAPRKRLAGIRAKKQWICEGGADPRGMRKKDREAQCRLVTIAEPAGGYPKRKRKRK